MERNPVHDATASCANVLIYVTVLLSTARAVATSRHEEAIASSLYEVEFSRGFRPESTTLWSWRRACE